MKCSGSDRARWSTLAQVAHGGVFSYVGVKKKSRGGKKGREDFGELRAHVPLFIIHSVHFPNLDLFAVAMLIWGKRNLDKHLGGVSQGATPSLTCAVSVNMPQYNFINGWAKLWVKLMRACFSLCSLYCHRNCFPQLHNALNNWFPQFLDTKITLLRMMIGTSQSESICVRTQQSSSPSDTRSINMQDFFCWGRARIICLKENSWVRTKKMDFKTCGLSCMSHSLQP